MGETDIRVGDIVRIVSMPNTFQSRLRVGDTSVVKTVWRLSTDRVYVQLCEDEINPQYWLSGCLEVVQYSPDDGSDFDGLEELL